MTSGPKPRVLLVLDSLAPGGAERSTVALLPLLAERGFELELATLHQRPGLQDEVRGAGVPLHELSPAGGRRGWVGQLRALVERTRPQLVHTSLYESDICGRLAAASRRVPVVSTIPTERYGRAHLDDPALRASRIRAAQLVDIATARLTRRIHAVSAHVAQATSQHLRYPRHRIDVVHRGRPATLADAHPVDRAWVRASLGVGDRKVVMTVARLDQAKGLDRVLTAWPELLRSVPDACLLLAGPEAGQGPALRSLAAELGIESTVQFLGHRTDVADLLHACDAFVLPSRREGLPGALIEAMATATPAVVSDLPQVTEIVNADEALIVDAADPSALAAAIADTVSDPGRARQRADRSQRRFRRELTLDRSADGMASFYRRSLDLTEAPVAIPPGTE